MHWPSMDFEDETLQHTLTPPHLTPTPVQHLSDQTDIRDRASDARWSHRKVQSRYRNNLSTSIQQLQDVVALTKSPTVDKSSNGEVDTDEHADSSKIGVIRTAIARVKQVTTESEKLTKEMRALENELETASKPSKCWNCLYMALVENC